MAEPWLSVVIPTLNEASRLPQLLDSLAPWCERGVELIVVDGGSTDATPTIAQSRVHWYLESPPSRSLQQHQGALVARGRWLWFVHADTRLPVSALEWMQGLRDSKETWGFFPVRLLDGPRLIVVVSWAMNLRSRWTRIATGDQCVFVHRNLYTRCGGFPPIALMEDVALSKCLRRLQRPLIAVPRVDASGRRWRQYGLWRTVLLMWWLRLAYALGADPAELRRRYYGSAS